MKGEFTDLVQGELFCELWLQNTYLRVPQAMMDDYAWGCNAANQPTRVNPGVFDADADAAGDRGHPLRILHG